VNESRSRIKRARACDACATRREPSVDASIAGPDTAAPRVSQSVVGQFDCLSASPQRVPRALRPPRRAAPTTAAALGLPNVHVADLAGGGPSAQRTVRTVLGGGPSARRTVRTVLGGSSSARRTVKTVLGGGSSARRTVETVLGGSPSALAIVPAASEALGLPHHTRTAFKRAPQLPSSAADASAPPASCTRAFGRTSSSTRSVRCSCRAGLPYDVKLVVPDKPKRATKRRRAAA
jgi:phage tail sheath gpL-like